MLLCLLLIVRKVTTCNTSMNCSFMFTVVPLRVIWVVFPDLVELLVLILALNFDTVGAD